MKSSASLIRCGLVSLASFALGAHTLKAQTNAPAAAPSNATASTLPADVTSALQLPEGSPERKKAIGPAVQAWGKSDPQAFLTWYCTLDPKHAFEVNSGISGCSESADPKAVADFIVQHLNKNNIGMLHGFILGWTSHDAAAAQAWSLQPSLPRDARYTALFSVADEMVRKDVTAKAAVAWTTSLPAGEGRLAAIDGTLCIWVRGDIVSATAWAKTLEPDEMKWAAYSIANNFRLAKGKGDSTLEAWIDQLPLSPADKAAVIKGPRPDGFHISDFKPATA